MIPYCNQPKHALCQNAGWIWKGWEGGGGGLERGGDGGGAIKCTESTDRGQQLGFLNGWAPRLGVSQFGMVRSGRSVLNHGVNTV